MKIYFLLFFIGIISTDLLRGQVASAAIDEDAAYTRTINTRAEKIVATLELSDPSTQKKVTSIIADQYRNLNAVYTHRDAQVKNVKEKEDTKEATEAEIKKIEYAVNERIAALHTNFLSSLSITLSPEQVTKVKDGMTYNVLNVTYKAYVDMIPSLKNEQKDQIMAWLVEAREYAMDAESSEKKHWWFGKYKGRINNYLSAQGYDITKERQDWEKRKSTTQSKAQ